MLSCNIKGRPSLPQRALIYALVQTMLMSPLVTIHLPAHAVMFEGGGEWGGFDWGGGGGDWGGGASEWGDYEGGLPSDGPDDAGDTSGSLDQSADAPHDGEEPDTSGPEASEEPAVDEEPADEDGGEEEEEEERKPEDPEECTGQVGNPINLARADKVEYQVDYRGRDRAALRVARVYHSNFAAYPASVNVRMGAGWRNFYDRSLQVLSGSQVRLHRYDGSVIDFAYSGAAWVGAQQAGSLSAISGGWQYVNPRNGVEIYASNGKLVSLLRKGRLTSLQYDSAGRLSSVTNPFGRALVFGYDSLNRVNTITTPGAATLAYGYDADGNLVSLTLPDGSVRRYVYENPSYRNALTGIVDETGRRIVSWGYDGSGRPNYNHFGSG